MFFKAILASLVAIVAWLFIKKGTTFYLLPKNNAPGVLQVLNGVPAASLDGAVSNYDDVFAGVQGKDMVDHYYTMATDFYLYGWGTSFHFGHQLKNESLAEALSRHEHRMAWEIGATEGTKVLDVGCGVGGPAREVHRYSKAHVTGVTLNAYQVAKATELNEQEGLTGKVDIQQMDFTQLAFDDNSFDAAYAVEAVCHAPNLLDVFTSVHRVLKPGGKFWIWAWLKTPLFNETDPEHLKIAHNIEYGDALPPMRTFEQLEEAAHQAGFDVIYEKDMATVTGDDVIPWYNKLAMSSFDIGLTHLICYVTEFLGLAPQGTVTTHGVLMHAADGLVAGGESGIFTPMHGVLLQKKA